MKRYIIQSSSKAGKTIQEFQPVFPGTPVVLMAQDSRGTPTYYGRRDIVNFMANVPIEAVPWKKYSLH
nr:hypothetical protein [Methanobrevibacter arboriphilus]